MVKAKRLVESTTIGDGSNFVQPRDGVDFCNISMVYPKLWRWDRLRARNDD